MCFDLDSHPPIAPIAGGALDHEDLTLRATDGTSFAAFRARAAAPSGASNLANGTPAAIEISKCRSVK